MKKIIYFIFSTVALFAFTPFLNAQTIAQEIGNLTFPQEKPMQVKSGVGFNKSISQPTSDGTYWIKLEAFSTGEATYTVTNEPADIVLVLDFSTSMTNNTYSTTSTYVPVTTTRQANYQSAGNPYGAFDYNNTGSATTGNNARYIHYENQYIPVQRGRVNGNSGGFFLYFETGGKTYYLDHYTITETMPTSYTNQYQAWWGGILYQLDNNVNRLEALKVAVAEFVDVIYHNDNYDEDDNLRDTPLGNRLSIVRYSSVGRSRVVKDWTNVTTASRAIDLTIAQSITAETATSNGNPNDNQTHSDQGMSLANGLLKDIKDNDTDRWESASRTVVMFTDGAPGESLNWTDPTSTTVANNCVEYAKETKSTYDATVFSVAVFNGTWTTAMRNYMNAVSSNYPNATSIADNDLGARCDDEETYGENAKPANYFKDAGEDLSGVFVEIAHQSGGSADSQLSAQSPAVDIVSSSFMLPPNATAANIKVFTAKCTYANRESGEYTFGQEILAKNRTDTYTIYDEDGNVVQSGVDVDNAISVSIGKDDNNNDKINVEGFDYANLWCGPITDESHNVEYQGYKVIIMIPVKMNPDAVGGPNVATNAPGSGLFVDPDDDTPLVTFDSPTVSLPVNVYIEKIGLKNGESAKFRIERAVIPAEDDWDPANIAETDWTYVSTVFVTNSPHSKISKNGYPMVQVRGMPATITVDNNGDGIPDVDGDGKLIQVGVVYRIVEENWAWSYTILNTAEYPNPQYTVTAKVDNPFSFKNEEKENIDVIVRHAESKATNVFKALDEGSNERYDDSKPNKRD